VPGFHQNVSDKQYFWLHSKAKEKGVSKQEIVRRIISKAMNNWQEGKEEEEEKEKFDLPSPKKLK